MPPDDSTLDEGPSIDRQGVPDHSRYRLARHTVTGQSMAIAPPGPLDPKKHYWDLVRQEGDVIVWGGSRQAVVDIAGYNRSAREAAWLIRRGELRQDEKVEHLSGIDCPAGQGQLCMDVEHFALNGPTLTQGERAHLLRHGVLSMLPAHYQYLLSELPDPATSALKTWPTDTEISLSNLITQMFQDKNIWRPDIDEEAALDLVDRLCLLWEYINQRIRREPDHEQHRSGHWTWLGGSRKERKHSGAPYLMIEGERESVTHLVWALRVTGDRSSAPPLSPGEQAHRIITRCGEADCVRYDSHSHLCYEGPALDELMMAVWRHRADSAIFNSSFREPDEDVRTFMRRRFSHANIARFVQQWRSDYVDWAIWFWTTWQQVGRVHVSALRQYLIEWWAPLDGGKDDPGWETYANFLVSRHWELTLESAGVPSEREMDEWLERCLASA